MRLRLKRAGVNAECFSRGLLSMPGQKVPEMALKVAKEFDVDLNDHVSQTLLAPDMDRAALVMVMRSEEHTSELQSLTNLVCRLLLEKKKNRKQ